MIKEWNYTINGEFKIRGALASVKCIDAEWVQKYVNSCEGDSFAESDYTSEGKKWKNELSNTSENMINC